MIKDVITDSIESTENNKALESWKKSLSECKMKMEKSFSKIYYCGNNLQIFSVANNGDIKIAHENISRIDESYDSTRTQEVQMEGKTKKLFHFIDTHSMKSCYHLEIFKCGKEECQFCKKIRMPQKIWDEISKRPRFLPLPESINFESWENNQDSMKYKSFHELKYKEIDEIYRLSSVRKPKSDKMFIIEIK